MKFTEELTALKGGTGAPILLEKFDARLSFTVN
jgi:hypothetical protein